METHFIIVCLCLVNALVFFVHNILAALKKRILFVSVVKIITCIFYKIAKNLLFSLF